MSAPETYVNENARLELLRVLAMWRDFRVQQGWSAGEEWVPLFEPEWDNAREDMVLATREAARLGHIETAQFPDDPSGRWLTAHKHCMVRITDAGYDWIRATDALGEARQESENRAALGGGSGTTP